MFLILLTAVTTIIIYKYIYKPLQYWKDAKIPYTRGWPIVGSLWESVLGLQAMAHVFQRSYNKFSNHRYFGFFLFNTPTLCIRDAELAKEICINNFDSFRDHRLFLPKTADPFWNKVLFSRKGQDWRDIRKIVTPIFSQNKMKHMFSFVSDCAQRLINNFSETETTTVEMSDLLSKFSNDLAIKCIFDVDCDSYTNPNNPFFSNGKTNFENTSVKSLKFFGAAISPAMANIFQVTFFSDTLKSFFQKVIDDIIDYRRKNNLIRQDLLYLLKEAQVRSQHENNEFKPNKITDEDILAQIIGFIYTNYDTVSTLMSNMVYELTLNTGVQEELIKEVDETWQKCKGKLSYDYLIGMKYMDMVTSETLRIRSPTLFIDRVVTKPYTINPVLPHEKPLYLKPGTDITIPVYCYHNDPQYFSEPEKFDPQRFNDDNKSAILPHTLLSFGIGPRACLGTRLVLLQLKLMVFYFLLKFRFVRVEKTSRQFSMSKVRISQYNEKKYWIGLQPRNSQCGNIH